MASQEKSEAYGALRLVNVQQQISDPTELKAKLTQIPTFTNSLAEEKACLSLSIKHVCLSIFYLI